jgi:hypothetical protein
VNAIRAPTPGWSLVIGMATTGTPAESASRVVLRRHDGVGGDGPDTCGIEVAADRQHGPALPPLYLPGSGCASDSQ